MVNVNGRYDLRAGSAIVLTTLIDEKGKDSSLLDSLRAFFYPMIKEAVATVIRDQKSDEPPRYPEKVGIAQASEITGYSRNSIYQFHSRRKIPGAIKVGGKLLFDTATLRRWVESGGQPL